MYKLNENNVFTFQRLICISSIFSKILINQGNYNIYPKLVQFDVRQGQFDQFLQPWNSKI